MEGFIAVEIGAHNPVEADEVVDVMMRQENGFEIAEASIAESGVFAGVEEQGVVATVVVDEQGGVADGTVDQSKVAKRSW